MNLNNLRKVALFGGKLVSTSNHLALETATKRGLGYGQPPSLEENDQFTSATANNPDPAQREFAENDASTLPAVRSILALTGLDHATHAAAVDNKLSLEGLAERLAAPRVNTIRTIAVAGRDLAAIGQAAHKTASEFYKPATLPVGDVQAASEDRELRDHWKASPLPKRTVMLQEMQDGQHERLLGALTRSPIPLEKHEASIVQGAWIDSVAKRHPARHAAVQAALDNHQWASDVCKASAQYARKSSGLSALEMMDAARGSGGEFLFSADTSTPAAHQAA